MNILLQSIISISNLYTFIFNFFVSYSHRVQFNVNVCVVLAAALLLCFQLIAHDQCNWIKFLGGSLMVSILWLRNGDDKLTLWKKLYD